MQVAAEGLGPSDLALVVNGNQVDVVNRHTGNLLESRGIESVSRVQLIGSDRVGDRFTIDLRRADSTIPDGIVIDGGLDAGNFITVLGTGDADTVTVDGNQLIVNGTSIDYSNVSLIHWVPGQGDDTVSVISEGEARFVVVDDGPTSHSPQRPGHSPSRPLERFAETGRGRDEGATHRRGEPQRSDQLAAMDAVLAEFDLLDLLDSEPVRQRN